MKRLIIVCACLAFAAGCGLQTANDVELPIPRPTRRPRPVVASPVNFTDITRAAGIHWKHNNGAFGLKFFPETMGSGAVFLDCDGDGLQDIFLVNGRDWTAREVEEYRRGTYPQQNKKYGFVMPPRPPTQRTTGALYRNNGDGTFSDITKNSGLDIEMYGMGAAVGDYDNDGRVDLYVTGYGRNYLFHNQSTTAQNVEGRIRFAEVSGAAGVRDAGFGSSAAWLDFDRDGRLDLFVCRYVSWQPAIDAYVAAGNNIAHKSYSPPTIYDGERSHLYRNLGNGRFADVSQTAGIRVVPYEASPSDLSSAAVMGSGDGRSAAEKARATIASRRAQTRMGKALGVTVCDPNDDGWPDILVANDTIPNAFYRNDKGNFSEIALKAGVALSGGGARRAGMGIDSGDIDNSARDSVVIGNFSDEDIGLYQNQGRGSFEDIAGMAEVGGASRSAVTFGCIFLDINNDSWLDIMAANGHVYDSIQTTRRDLSYAQRTLLFLNRRQTSPLKFDEISQQSGAALQEPIVGRGLAAADIDLDGDIDVLITTNGGAPKLLRNDLKPTARKNNALRLTLQGTKSNRSAIGAVVEIVLRSGNKTQTLRRTVKSGASYLSQNELPLTVGLGAYQIVQTLTVRWPSGHRTVLSNIKADSALIVREDKGLISQKPLQRS